MPALFAVVDTSHPDDALCSVSLGFLGDLHTLAALLAEDREVNDSTQLALWDNIYDALRVLQMTAAAGRKGFSAKAQAQALRSYIEFLSAPVGDCLVTDLALSVTRDLPALGLRP